MLSILTGLKNRFRASSYSKDIAWLASGTIIAQAVMLASMPIYSRLYSPADFAIQNLFIQFVGFMAVAATLRYEYFIQLPKRNLDSQRLIHLVFFLGVAATVLLTPVAWLFRTTFARWAGDAALAPWLIFVPVSAMVLSLSVAVQGSAQRRNLFRRSGEAEVAGKIGFSGTIFAGYFMLPGAGGLVFAWLTGPCIKIAWLLSGTRRLKFGGYKVYLRLAKKYGKMSGSMALSHVLMSCTSLIPIVYITREYGAATLGQYALASQVVSLPSALLGSAIGSVYYQRASACWARGLSFGDIWQSTAKKLLLIGLPIYSLATLIIPFGFPLIFGNVWRPAGQYGAILAISAFFSFASTPMDKACLVVGAWWYIPTWHAARTATTGLVTGMALYFHWGVNLFLIVLTLQQIVLYLVDYWSQRSFAHRVPAS